MGRFTPWSDDVSAAPGGAAMVQVKALGTLFDYPTGKSAMVWYGVVAPCTAERLEHVMGALRSSRPELVLVWRYRLAASPDALLAALLQRFESRFGAPPRLPGH
ncbi:MAG: hypothetical protein QF464_21585 [Myxococcota bacterium]|nr:hypothetical protein [Myxococcota bacterium]